MIQSLLRFHIEKETDIVWIRNKAREIAQYLELESHDQTRVGTAISEITRNSYQYAKDGSVEFSLIQKEARFYLRITVKDHGKGIANLKEIQNGTYVSGNGMGIGLMGAKKLMDSFYIQTSELGTLIHMDKVIAKRTRFLIPSEHTKLIQKLRKDTDLTLIDELQKQNREILFTIAELNEKKDELTRLNKELQDTNRGVVALYAELDEKAAFLKIASEAKTSFLSNMTHEFRSPLNSILSIANIIRQEAIQINEPEREKQIGFIIKAANDLSDMVNDLLDIAKIEAGKTKIKTNLFTVATLFSTLRGLMKPINNNERVFLNFEETLNDRYLSTDEAKLSQILRNLISNALKYTEKGEVTVSARFSEDGFIFFEVRDTGIGIAAENLHTVFEEFFQVDNSLQKKSKGTGLGLPLSKKLAQLLNGHIEVESKPEKGSVFKLKIPIVHGGPEEIKIETSAPRNENKKLNAYPKVLVIDDDVAIRYSLSKALSDFDITFKEAQNAIEGFQVAQSYKPDLIILDLVMPEKNGIDFINDCMKEKNLRSIPIFLHTSKILETEEKKFLKQTINKVILKDPGNKYIKKAVAEFISHRNSQ